ncbi:MAG: urea ABC transporter permease subunit UrtB [Polyangiaceae bacterium]
MNRARLHRRTLRTLVGLILTLFSPTLLAANDIGGCLRSLDGSDVSSQRASIECAVAVGSDEARQWLVAYRDGRLRVDDAKHHWIETSGRFIELPGSKAGMPEGTPRPLFASNVVRKSLDEGLARLRLSSPRLEERRSAASELALDPPVALTDFLRERARTETDAATKKELRRALAKLDLSSKNPRLRISAANTIAELGDVTMQEALDSLLQRRSDGTYVEADADVRRALREALSTVNGRQLLIRTAANTVYGLSLGSVLLLAALGLSITFGLMRVINMAHGELLMLGAYSTHVAADCFARYLPEFFDYYLVLAIPLAFIVSGLVGFLLERLVIRKLYGRPLETLLATWGLSLILVQAVRALFGAQNVAVANPEWLKGGWELIPTVVIPYSRVAVLCFTAFVVAFVWFVLNRTTLGLKVRAVTSNREMAAALGIPTQKVDLWTFSLGSAVAGLGGVALSQLGNVGPELGQQHIVDSFMVVVLGGVGNLFGTIFGALGLGLGAKYLEPAMGAVLGKIIILTILIAFIQWRPSGLFALKGRTQEL